MFANDEKPKSVRECMERLKKARDILVSDEYGYTDEEISFNPPATEEFIAQQEKSYGFKIPEDCKEFFMISNGAIILDNEIYGVDYIGMSDDFVPDEYLCFGGSFGTSERYTLSENGEFYICYDCEPESWEFKDFLFLLLEKCEVIIDEHDREVARQKRREAGITEEQERAALRAEFEAERKRYEATLDPETVKKQREERDDLIARVLKALEEDTNKHN